MEDDKLNIAHSAKMKKLYDEHVCHAGSGHWKDACSAKVPPELADEVEESMNFFGSIVCKRTEKYASIVDPVQGLIVHLESEGYWANGF